MHGWKRIPIATAVPAQRSRPNRVRRRCWRELCEAPAGCDGKSRCVAATWPRANVAARQRPREKISRRLPGGNSRAIFRPRAVAAAAAVRLCRRCAGCRSCGGTTHLERTFLTSGCTGESRAAGRTVGRTGNRRPARRKAASGGGGGTICSLSRVQEVKRPPAGSRRGTDSIVRGQEVSRPPQVRGHSAGKPSAGAKTPPRHRWIDTRRRR
jgi:hypothetical protein